MSWNHRVMRHIDDGEEWFAVHEVYYDTSGKPNGVTKYPVAPGGSSQAELTAEVERYASALSKPVLDYCDVAGEK